MKYRFFVTAGPVWFPAALFSAVLLFAGGLFADSVIVSSADVPNNGEADMTQSGTIAEVTRDKITLKDRAGVDSTIEVNRVVETHYDGEPVNLQVARTAIDSAQYENALRSIADIQSAEKEKASQPVKDDIDFCWAQGSALLALSGHPEMKLATAVSRLNDFISKHGDSWHYYEANRLIGQVLTADGKAEQAKTYYQNLTKAPWPETQVEGNILLADILLNTGDSDGAEKAYNEVLKTPDAPGVEGRKDYARIGLARIAAIRKDSETSAKLFRTLIEKSDPDDVRLQASIYNAMGSAAESAGDPKSAIIAYLHVDLLYSTASAEHIEALRHLVKLWKQQLREDRAAEAQTILKERYKISE